MKISVILVTWNRCDLVRDTLQKNRASSGREWDELVWVDNGSTDGTSELAVAEKPDALVLFKNNQGVSKGYNRALSLCAGDWIAIPGDRNIMPQNWLKMWAEIAETDQVDVVSLWVCDYGIPTERHLPGEIQTLAGHRCRPGIAFDTIIFRRSLLSTAGYWRGDFGMY